MAKAAKIAELTIAFYEDSKCVIKSTLIHRIEGVGTVREIVPKKELVEFIATVTPPVKIDSILNDVVDNQVIGIVAY